MAQKIIQQQGSVFGQQIAVRDAALCMSGSIFSVLMGDNRVGLAALRGGFINPVSYLLPEICAGVYSVLNEKGLAKDAPIKINNDDNNIEKSSSADDISYFNQVQGLVYNISDAGVGMVCNIKNIYTSAYQQIVRTEYGVNTKEELAFRTSMDGVEKDGYWVCRTTSSARRNIYANYSDKSNGNDISVTYTIKKYCINGFLLSAINATDITAAFVLGTTRVSKRSAFYVGQAIGHIMDQMLGHELRAKISFFARYALCISCLYSAVNFDMSFGSQATNMLGKALCFYSNGQEELFNMACSAVMPYISTLITVHICGLIAGTIEHKVSISTKEAENDKEKNDQDTVGIVSKIKTVFNQCYSDAAKMNNKIVTSGALEHHKAMGYRGELGKTVQREAKMAVFSVRFFNVIDASKMTIASMEENVFNMAVIAGASIAGASIGSKNWERA